MVCNVSTGLFIYFFGKKKPNSILRMNMNSSRKTRSSLQQKHIPATGESSRKERVHCTLRKLFLVISWPRYNKCFNCLENKPIFRPRNIKFVHVYNAEALRVFRSCSDILHVFPGRSDTCRYRTRYCGQQTYTNYKL